MKKIAVLDYDPEWAVQFNELKQIVEVQLSGLILGIEHVGSTAVVGLAAKPIIDIDIIIDDVSHLNKIIPKLADLGYVFRGDLGIQDRYAFSATTDCVPITPSGRKWLRHHLYCCILGSPSLENHLILRDALRNNPALVKEYALLKKQLADLHPYDMDAYIEGKSSFIGQILEQGGMSQTKIDDIERQNRKSI
jgi:GrpB-like predicted nucleotidyltransferase (UPF0157 family)